MNRPFHCPNLYFSSNIKDNMKVTPYLVHIWFLFLLWISSFKLQDPRRRIITSLRKLSVLHAWVISLSSLLSHPTLLPPTLPLGTSAPLPHKCLLDRVENSVFISCDFCERESERKKNPHRSLSLLFKATWRFLSSQSLLGIWGRRGSWGGGGQQQKDGGNKKRERERTDMRDAGGKWIKVCGWGNGVWANREIVPNLVTVLNTWLPPWPSDSCKRTPLLPPRPSTAPKPQTPSYLSLFLSGLLHTGRKRSYLSPVSIWQPWVTRCRTA